MRPRLTPVLRLTASQPVSPAYPAPPIPPSYSQSPTAGPSAVTPALPNSAPARMAGTTAPQRNTANTTHQAPAHLRPQSAKADMEPGRQDPGLPARRRTQIRPIRPGPPRHHQRRRRRDAPGPDRLPGSRGHLLCLQQRLDRDHRNNRRRHHRLPDHPQHANPRDQKVEPGSRHCVEPESPPPATPPSSLRTTLRPQRSTPSRATTCARSPNTPMPSSRN